MAHPGHKAGDDYYIQPYLEGWRPLPEREWATEFINADGTERYHEFVDAFKQRHPFLQVNQVWVYLPATVDDYVRHDTMGVRQDIDWEMALLPPDEEEKKKLEELKRAKVKAARERVIEARKKQAEPGGIADAEPPKRGPGRPRKDAVSAVDLMDS